MDDKVRKITTGLLLILVAGCVAGCVYLAHSCTTGLISSYKEVSEPEASESKATYLDEDNRFELDDTGAIGGTVHFITDTETGVQYLYISRGGASALTVLLDADGKPLLREDFKQASNTSSQIEAEGDGR